MDLFVMGERRELLPRAEPRSPNVPRQPALALLSPPLPALSSNF